MDLNSYWSGDSYNNIMKDYAINWILYAVWKSKYWKNFILKGGTCIRKVYFQNYRISVDVDYNAIYDASTLRNILRDIFKDEIENVNEVSPVKFEIDNIVIKERKGTRFNRGEVVGYQIKVPFHPYLPKTNLKWRGVLPVIKIDVTLDKYEKTLLSTNIKKLNYHNEEDDYLHYLQDVEINAYSLEEIFAEKIRALFQRTRVRDLYDLWFIKNSVKIDMDKIIEIIPSKLEIKGLSVKDISISKLQKYENEYRTGWDMYLPQFVKNVPKFEDVWNDVKSIIAYIENAIYE